MPSPTAYDLVIRNALILDGTGAPGQPGDLAVEGGAIARIESAGTISAMPSPRLRTMRVADHGLLPFHIMIVLVGLRS